MDIIRPRSFGTIDYQLKKKMSFGVDYLSTEGDLLDILFNHNDGILVENDENSEEKIQNGDILPFPELTFSDSFSCEFLDGLNEIDLLSGFLDANGNMSPSAELSTPGILSHHGSSHESDHQYCRPSDDSMIQSQTVDPPSGSPLEFGYNSISLFSASNSPTGMSSSTSDNFTLSPGSMEQSPLGGSVEHADVMVGFDPISFLRQENGSNHLFNDREDLHENGILSLDMDTTDVDSGSDDGSMFTTLTDSSSMFEFSQRTSRKNGGLPFTVHDSNFNSDAIDQQDLRLSEEERRLLAREGIELPNDLPLTKEEERALKAVRRKIRNKISAKVSRRRKQEYVDGLEKRVKMCTIHNRQLQQKVDKLEKQNITLMSQLKQFQAMLMPRGVTDSLMTMKNMVTRKQVQTGTCIMVLVLSFGLFVLPSLNPFFDPIKQQHPKSVGPGRSRSLLEEVDNQLFSAIGQNNLYSEKFDRNDDDPNYANVPYPFRPNPDIPASKRSTADISDTSVLTETEYNATVSQTVKSNNEAFDSREPVEDNINEPKDTITEQTENSMKVKNNESLFVSEIDDDEGDSGQKMTRNDL